MLPSSTDAAKALTDYSANRKPVQDVINTAQSQYDIPGFNTRLSGLRTQVGNLQSAAEAVDPQVTARTARTFTTDAQRGALINREQQPILTNLGKQQQAYGNEMEGYNQASSNANNLAQAMLNQDSQTYQQLLDQYNRSSASEQAAQQQKNWQAQFDQQNKQTSGYDLSSILKGLQAQPPGMSNVASKTATLTGGKTKEDAQAAIRSLVSTNDPNRISQTISAIAKSAGYGNTYDQAKLQLLQATVPGFFDKGTNNVNTSRLQGLASNGLLNYNRPGGVAYL